MRRAAPLALLAAAAVCALLGLTHQAGSPLGAGPPPVLTPTPVLSARRTPALVAALAATQRLAAAVETVGAAGSSESCLQVDVGGSPVYARDATAALLPASNIKLLTAFAAVTRLGADSHFTTAAVAAKPPNAGVVDGPLVLVGGGDPLLATAAYRPSQTEWTLSSEPVTKLEDLADRVKAAGVTHITGGVVADDSRYDSERTIATWKPSYVTSGEIGPVGALEVNGGFTVEGKRKVPNLNPGLSVAQELAGLLSARGVAVDGGASAGAAPAGAVTVAAVDSPTLGDEIGIMLRESDNLAAEMLVKELGRRFGGAGSWAAGLRVVRDTLTTAHIPTDGLVMVDGSGLDRGDRATCATLAALTAMGGPAATVVDAGLPRATNCGTLVKRFVGQPWASRVRAKTGSLTGVAALTGFVDSGPPTPLPPCPPPPGSASRAAAPAPASLTFALLGNGFASEAAGRSFEDRTVAALATYPQAPPLEALGP